MFNFFARGFYLVLFELECPFVGSMYMALLGYTGVILELAWLYRVILGGSPPAQQQTSSREPGKRAEQNAGMANAIKSSVSAPSSIGHDSNENLHATSQYPPSHGDSKKENIFLGMWTLIRIPKTVFGSIGILQYRCNPLQPDKKSIGPRTFWRLENLWKPNIKEIFWTINES